MLLPRQIEEDAFPEMTLFVLGPQMRIADIHGAADTQNRMSVVFLVSLS